MRRRRRFSHLAATVRQRRRRDSLLDVIHNGGAGTIGLRSAARELAAATASNLDLTNGRERKPGPVRTFATKVDSWRRRSSNVNPDIGQQIDGKGGQPMLAFVMATEDILQARLAMRRSRRVQHRPARVAG